MNQELTTRPDAKMTAVGISTGSGGSKIAPQNLGEVVRFAEVMSRADIALPKHLRGNPGACMAVALQALEWEMSPFAVASKSYAVNGAIAYEAQLIAAVVNTRSGIKGRLKYSYEGEGDSLQCTVTGKLDGEEYSYTSPRFDHITPKNSPLWKTDPKQQIGYYSARSWARRYTPEVILGVYDRDEAQEFRGPENAKDVTPLQQRLEQAREATQDPQDEQEGFDLDHVSRETETRSSDYQSDDTAPNPSSDEGDEPPSTPSSPSTHTEADSSRVDASDEGGGNPPKPSPSPIPIARAIFVYLQFLLEDVDGLSDSDAAKDGLRSIVKVGWADEFMALGDGPRDQIKQIRDDCFDVIDQKPGAGIVRAKEKAAEMLGCAIEDFEKKEGE